MMTIQNLYLVHHSHTDIGYTHTPTTAMELHGRFIDHALDLIDKTADWPGGSAMRWTCETTMVVEHWLRQASTLQVDRFVEAAQRGVIEVTALWCNLTPLFDAEQLYALMEPVETCRCLGIPVRSAMNSDSNGLPWGIVDLLLDAGVTGLSMAINEHMGRAPFKRPGAFKWASPTGRELTVWNGFLYNDSRFYGVPRDIEEARVKLDALVARLEAEGYPYDFIEFQATYQDFSDNGPPDLKLCEFVRKWNDRGLMPYMRIATLGEFMDAVRERGASLPTYAGEWGDQWNFGVGSAVRETAVNRVNHDRMVRAESLQVVGLDSPRWLRRQRQVCRDALRHIAMYNEHTFGADTSISNPDDPRVSAEWCEKSYHVFKGQALTQLGERDGIISLMNRVNHEGKPGALIFNPAPDPQHVITSIPIHWIEPPYPMRSSHLHSPRGYGQSARPKPVLWAGPFELPGWGYRWIPAEEWIEDPAATGTVAADECSLESDQLRVELNPTHGGISGLIDKATGRQWVESANRPLGAYLYETVDSSDGRGAIFTHDAQKIFISRDQWNRDWPAKREQASRVVRTAVHRQPDRVTVVQDLEAPGVNKLTYRYVVYPHRSGVELEVVLDIPPDVAPHARYLIFPFAISDATCRFESAGAVIDAHREIMPETCRDFLSIQRWIDVSGPSSGVTIVTRDVPLWMVGGFHFGRLMDQVDRSSTIVAWLTNNYWDTNFRASQSGVVSFRMTVFPHGAFDPAETARLAGQATHRPICIPTTDQPSGDWPLRGQLLLVHAEGVVPLIMRPQPDRTILMRLQNVTGQARLARIEGGQVRVRSAWLADVWGNRTEEIGVAQGCFEIVVPARAIKTVIVAAAAPLKNDLFGVDAGFCSDCATG